MIEAGGANPLFLFIFALALGALHGLEPGHSKTMMAAYIIAIRGTAGQAALLGLSAALSHSVVVWALAMMALYWGDALIGEKLEPWLMIVSGLLILAVAGWMLIQYRRAKRQTHDHHNNNHHHHHDHRHHPAADAGDAHLDAHARAHAAEIRERLSSGRTGPWQTILFGLTGGLIPCPGAITVCLLCLNLGKAALGVTLVAAFSIGLALTLVSVGVVAALGLKAMRGRGGRLDALMEAAPWISAALIAAIGLVMIWSGLHHVPHAH